MLFTEEELNNLEQNPINSNDPPSTFALTEDQLDLMEKESLRQSSSMGAKVMQGIDPAEFDFSLKGGDFDNYLYRAQDQPWGTQLLSGVAKAIPNAALDVVGNVASILDFEDYVNQDNEVGNDIVRAVNEAKEGIEEALPIYRERPGASLDVGDPAWWFENGSGILSSALGFAATGFGTGAALSKGAKALQWVAQSRGAVKAAGAIGAAAEVAVPAANILALNQAEGMLTAVELYDETYKQATKQGFDDVEAKRMSANAAAHSINVNRTNILLNITSVNAFTKGISKGMTRQILKKDALGKTVALESAQEYAEEVVNLYAEKEGRRQADFALLGKHYDIPSTAGERAINTVFSLEGLEAGLLGAVGGAAQTGFTHLGRNVAINGKSKNAEINKRIADQKAFISELDGKLKDAGGKNYYTAMTSLENVTESIKEREQLLKLAEEYTAKGEEIPARLVHDIQIKGDEILLDQSIANFKQGTTAILEKGYRDLAGMSPEEAKNAGYTGEQLDEKSPAYYKSRAERALQKIGEYEKIYNQHYNFRNLGAIMANRVAVEASKEALVLSNTETQEKLFAANEVNNTLPLYGLERRPAVEEFEKLSKTGTAKQKRYITNAKKKRGIKPYTDAVERNEKIAKSIVELDKNYKKQTSYKEQRLLRQLEKEAEQAKEDKINAEKATSQANKDLAEAQDNVADQADAIKIPEAPVNNTGVVTEGVEGDVQPEVQGIQGYVGPEVDVEDAHLTDEERAILAEAQADVQKEVEEEIADVLEDVRKENNEANQEHLKDSQEAREAEKEIGYQPTDEVDNKANVVSIQTKLKDENVVDSKAFSIGYLAEELTGELNADVNPLIFDYDKINVGTKIKLTDISDTYDGNVYHNGEKVPWQGLKNELSTEEALLKFPIAIVYEEQIIGFVHDATWFNEENKGKGSTVEEEVQKNLAIREEVLKKGDISTTINFRGNGVFPTTPETKPVATNLPGVKIAVIKNNQLSDFKDLNIINRATLPNGKRLKNGHTVAIIPVNKAEDNTIQYVGAPLLRQELNPQAKKSIVQAITIMMKDRHFPESVTDAENQIVTDIEEQTDFNIKNKEGLKGYVNLFTHTTIGEDFKNLEEFMLTQEENRYVMDITPYGAAFGKGGKPLVKDKKNVLVPFMFKSAPNEYLEGLENVVNHLYAHVDSNLLDKTVTVPIINEEGKVEPLFTGNYNDYIAKYALHTDITAHEIGTEENPKQVNTVQAVITYDGSFAGVTEDIKPIDSPVPTDIDEDMIADAVESAEIEAAKEAPADIPTPPKGMEGFFKGLKPDAFEANKDVEEEETDDLFAPFSGEITSDYIVSGLTSAEQSLLITNILANVIENVSEEDNLLTVVGNSIDYFVTYNMPSIKSEAWKLKKVARVELQNFISTTIQNEDEAKDTTEANDEERSVEERDTAWGTDLLTVNPKDKLSSRLKRLFAFTPELDITTDKELVTKQGLTVYTGPDKAYNTIMAILAENFNRDERAPQTFKEMMETLKSFQTTYPFLVNLVDKLESASRQLQNEFMVNADKHYVQMYHVRKGFSTKKGTYFNVLEDNANSRKETIKALWRNNNLFRAAISDDLRPNMDVVNGLMAEYDSWVAKGEFEDTKVLEWLKKMGITITQDTLNAFKDVANPVEGLEYVNHFLVPKGIFYNFRQNLSLLTPASELLESDLYTKDAISRLANQEARYNAMYVANLHRSGNNNIYSFQEHKYASKRTADLKYDTEVLARLARDPATKDLSWLKALGELDADGNFIVDKESRFYQKFRFSYIGLGALIDADSYSRQRKKLSELSARDHEEVKMAMFHNKYTADARGNRTVQMFFPTMSDKSKMFTATVEALNVAYNSKGELSTTTINKLFDSVVMSELNRMNNFNPGKENIEGYEQGAMMFYSIPELNNVPNIIIQEGEVRKLNPKALITGEIENKALKEAFKVHLDQVVTNQIQDWIDLGIYNPDIKTLVLDNQYDKEYLVAYSENVEEKAKLAAADYSLNYMLANANFQNLFAGDVAQYYTGTPRFKEDYVNAEGDVLYEKGEQIPVDNETYYAEASRNTYVNVGKRLAQLSGPRRSPVIINGESTYTQGFLQDKIGTSLAIDYLESLFEDAPEAAKAYKDIVATDAQEFITVFEKIKNLYGDGKIDKQDYKKLMAIANTGNDFTSSDLAKLEVFQVDKPLYSGSVYGDNSKVGRQLYIKSSAVTLLPQFTRGLEIDKLRTLMENRKNPIDRVAFSSAVKVGNVIAPLDIWTEEGIANELNFNDLQTLTLNRADYGIQQEIPHKESETIKRVSQATKLAFVNILDEGGFTLEGEEGTVNGRKLQQEYINNWEKLYKTSSEELFEELEVDITADVPVPNPEKLKKILQEEAEKRNLALQDIEGLELLEDGSFELPLWASAGGKQFEALLSSLIGNKVLQQKMPGKSYVLSTEEGIQKTVVTLEEFGNPSEITFVDSKFTQLKPSTEVAGKITNNGVIIPWPFKGVPMSRYIKADGTIDMSKISPELLNMYGMRIPNQGPNSTANLRIAGFLPEVMGDIVIAPRDFITQMGSDFDVDKLYTYMFNHIVDEKGNITKVSEDSIDEAKLKRREGRVEKALAETALLDMTKDRRYKLKLLNAELQQIQKYLEPNALLKVQAQDKIVEIHRAINANPSELVQKQVRTPLGEGKLGDHARTVEHARNKEEFFSPYTPAYQRTKFKNAATGNAAIGVFAIANTFNALAQVVEDDITMYDGQEPLEVTFGTQKSEGKLNRVKTLDESTFISNNISDYVSAAVDNEKLQILHNLNINDLTYSVVGLLNQLGFTQDVVSSFMSQDILFDVVEEVDKLRSQGVSIANSLEKAFETVIKEDKYIDETFNELDEEVQKQRIQKASVVGHKTLFDVIKKGEAHEDYKLIQRTVLEKFRLLYTKGGELSNLQRTTNIDSSGLGKNLIESATKEEGIFNILTKSPIRNARSLFGVITDPGFNSADVQRAEENTNNIRLGNIFFEPTTIAGFAVAYGLLPNNRLWNQSKYFPYTLQAVNDTMDTIINNSNIREFEEFRNAEVKGRIFNGIKSYIFSQMDMLGFIDPALSQDSGRLARFNLLAGEGVLQSYVVDHENSELFRENPFLNKLSVRKRRRGTPASINFDSRIENNSGKLNVYNGLIKLLNSTKKLPENMIIDNKEVVVKTEQDLARALIASQYASGGIQKFTQFLRYIPVDYLKKTGFTQGIREVDFGEMLNEGSGQNKYTLPYFVVQFFQHNTTLLPSPNVPVNEFLSKDKEKEEDISEFIIPLPEDPKEHWKIKPMLKLQGKNGFNPFLFDGSKYVRLDKLGGTDFNEYQQGEMTRSLIYDNIAWNKSYYDQVSSNSVNSEAEAKAENINHLSLDEKYGFTGSEPSISNTLNRIANGGPADYRALAQDLAQVFREGEYGLVIDRNLPVRGRHIGGKTKVLIVNPENLNGDDDYAKTFLHETIHLLTNDVLASPSTEAQKSAKASLNRLFRSYQKTLKPGELNSLKEKIKTARAANIAPNLTEDEISRVYPAVSLKEFVAGFMTDSNTQKHLNNVKFSGETTYGEEYEKRLLRILKSIKGFQLQSTSAQAMRDVISLLDYNEDTKEDNPSVIAKMGNSTSNNVDNVKPPEKRSFRHTTEDIGFKPTKSMAQAEASFLGFDVDLEAQIEAAIENNIPLPSEEEFSKSLAKDDPTTFEDLPAVKKKEKKEVIDVEHPVIRNKKNIIQDLYRKKARDTKKLHEADNATIGAYYESRINRSEEKIAELEQEILDIESISTYENTLEVGKQDLAYVDTILSADKALITDEDMEIAGRIIDLWKNFQKTPFVTEIYKNKDYKEDFNILKNKAEELEDVLHDVSVEKTKAFVKRELTSLAPSEVEKIMEASDDIGMVSSYVYDISRADNAILQASAKAIMKANNRTTEEVSKIADEVDPKLRAAEKALKEKGLNFDIFQQKDEKGRKTGRLVMPYSQKYFESVKRNSAKAFSKEATKKDKETFREWQELTQIVINPAKLSDAKYLSSIEKEVGAESLPYIKGQALKQQHYYEEARAREEIRLQNDLEITPEQRETRLAIWEAKYNPETSATKKGAVDVKGTTVWPSPTFTVSVPRKVTTKGEETGFYDENFAIIQNDPNLKEFHDYTMDLLETLGNYTPYTKDPVNTIPLMQKTFWEASKGQDAQTIFNLMSSAMKKGSRAKGVSDNYVMDDYAEGRMLANNLNEVMKRNRSARMEVKRIQYMQTEGKEPTKKLEKEWFADITNELVEESSFDLGRVLKTYAATAIAYKHKSQIETSLRVSERLLKDIRLNKRSTSGAILNHAEGQSSPEGVENMIKMYESTLDTFFGKPKVERIGKKAKKNYTTEEKAKKAELQGIIDTAEKNLASLDAQYDKGDILKDDYNTRRSVQNAHIESANNQLEKLGGTLSTTKAARGMLQYIQLIGMGWNIVAGMANLGFGQMSNMIEASGGEHYGLKQLLDATGTVIRSTFGGIKTQEGRKISKLMKRWGILQKSSNEVFEQKTSKNRILNLINPYKPQDTTEYINQAPLMVMYQKKTPVLDAEGNPMVVNGEEVNFYNAYDETGEWQEDVLGVKEDADHIQSQKDSLKINIGDMVKRNHGNYDSRGSHLQIKDSVLGQALTQFRTWMFEGFGNRFRREYEDRITGTTKKGRYVTIFEDLGRAAKLLYSRKTWGELSKVDRANVKKTFAEMSMYLSLWGMIAIMKASAEDEEDEDQLAVFNTLINLSLRMQTDIAFYVNPADFENLTQSTIPAANIISNFYNLMDASYRFIQGDDEILTGVHAGDSRVIQKASKVVPFGAAMYKAYNIQSQIFEQ